MQNRKGFAAKQRTLESGLEIVLVFLTLTSVTFSPTPDSFKDALARSGKKQQTRKGGIIKENAEITGFGRIR